MSNGRHKKPPQTFLSNPLLDCTWKILPLQALSHETLYSLFSYCVSTRMLSQTGHGSNIEVDKTVYPFLCVCSCFLFIFLPELLSVCRKLDRACVQGLPFYRNYGISCYTRRVLCCLHYYYLGLHGCTHFMDVALNVVSIEEWIQTK